MKAKKKGKSKMEDEIFEQEELETIVEKTLKKHRLVFERLDEL